MKLIHSLLIISFAFFPQILWAKNTFILLGAGGERDSSKSSTLFDQNLIELKPSLENSNWESSVAFNGGHSDTTKILDGISGLRNKDVFSLTTYKDYLNKIKEEILSGKIKESEQLLIYIDSHGAIRNKGANQISHSISTTDNTQANLDDLQEIINLAEQKNIHLAITDMSCHSGSLLNLKFNNQKTCLISATGEKNFGYSAFAENFSREIANGQNFEEAFMNARMKELGRAYPMINSGEGLEVQSVSKIIGYSFFANGTDPTNSSSDKLNIFIEQYIRTYPNCDFSIPPSFSENIERMIKLASDSGDVLKKTYDSLLKFKYDLNYQFKKINEALKIANQLKKYNIANKCFKVGSNDFCLDYNTLAKTPYETWLFKSRSKLAASVKEDERKTYQDEIDYYSKAIEVRNGLNNDNEFIKCKNLNTQLTMKKIDIENIGQMLVSEERQFYNFLYGDYRITALKDQNNACRQFKM